MITDHLSQQPERDVVPEAGQPRGDEQVAQLGGWPLSVQLPILLTPTDLQRVFQIAESTYFKHLADFARFEAPSVMGSRRYLGSKLRAFLEGGASARTFGAKRGPRPVVATRVAVV
jgi:hypothetical protein